MGLEDREKFEKGEEGTDHEGSRSEKKEGIGRTSVSYMLCILYISQLGYNSFLYMPCVSGISQLGSEK